MSGHEFDLGLTFDLEEELDGAVQDRIGGDLFTEAEEHFIEEFTAWMRDQLGDVDWKSAGAALLAASSVARWNATTTNDPGMWPIYMTQVAEQLYRFGKGGEVA